MNYEEKAKEIMELIPTVQHMHTRKFMDALSKGEDFMLACVAKNGGMIMPGEIAKTVGVSTARVAAVLNAAENKGYIRRENVEGDRRKTQVILTDAGFSKVQSEHRKSLERMVLFLEKLGEEDTDHLIRIMDKMKGIINSDELNIKEAEK